MVVISWIIGPIALLLFWSQIRNVGGFDVAISLGLWRDVSVQSVAGIIGMVPEGLGLLTSVNFALAALILARRSVLVQELPAVEVLARVDTLCLDQTGTLTDGSIELVEIIIPTVLHIAVPRTRPQEVLKALASARDANATAAAVLPGVKLSQGQGVGCLWHYACNRRRALVIYGCHHGAHFYGFMVVGYSRASLEYLARRVSGDHGGWLGQDDGDRADS